MTLCKLEKSWESTPKFRVHLRVVGRWDRLNGCLVKFNTLTNYAAPPRSVAKQGENAGSDRARAAKGWAGGGNMAALSRDAATRLASALSAATTQRYTLSPIALVLDHCPARSKISPPCPPLCRYNSVIRPRFSLNGEREFMPP